MHAAARLSILALLLAGCGQSFEARRRAESAFEAQRERLERQQTTRYLADDLVYEDLLALFPELATRQGDDRYNDRLSDPSPEGRRRYAELLERKDVELKAIETRSDWDLELALLRTWLDTEIAGLPYNGTTFLLDSIHGFHLELPKLLAEMPYRGLDDCRVALARLEKVPRYFDGVIESLRADGESDLHEARPIVEKVLAQIELQLAMKPEENPFLAPFKELPDSISPADRDEVTGRATERLIRDILPTLKRFRDFLATEYLPKARDDVGIWATPNGEARYRWCVQRYTTTDLTPDAIHELGLREVARIRSEMEDIRKKVGFEGDLKAFFQHLRTAPRFYFTEPEDLLRGYRDICKRADAALPLLFGKLPRAPYGVIPIPDFAARSATSAYYNVPPAGGMRPGYFYANTYRLEMRPKYEMEALALHESVPGHHLQLGLQIELEGVSKFRSRWLEFTAFVEGWGLYAERLGLELGFYQDPYSDFGRLTYEMWRACRLVVDTGMHHKRWTRDRAIRLMLDNSALTQLNVESEIDRYITWPGQALAYKIGEIKIRKLRAEAEEALGERFDVRAFHDLVLAEGSITLSLLELRVRRWIEALRSGAES